MPALNTAVAGLRLHQQKIDALADNIANVNTVGFKGSRTGFSESFYQTLRTSSSNQPVGIQIGSGGQVATIGTLHSQGSLQRTGGPTDIGISGDGFFVVRNASGATLFTRAGDFTLDRAGNLINSLGMNVRGVVGNASSQTGDAIDPGTAAPSALSNIVIPSSFVSQAAAVAATGTITVGTDLPDAGDTLTVGGVAFTFIAAGVPTTTEILIGADTATTAANITTSLNANATTAALITASISTNVVTVTADTSGSAGNAIAMSTTATTAELSPSATLSGGIDLGALRTETVTSFTIGLDGKVSLFGTAGTTRVIAFMVIARFSNPPALQKIGNNLYQFAEAAGAFSGSTSFSETQDTRKAGTNGFGQLQSGALELSNVDLANEFAEMIVTQRGFEANARVITTGDELLQTVVNLRR